MKTQRTIISAFLAVALSAILAVFYCAEGFVPPVLQTTTDTAAGTAQRTERVRPFHELDRLEMAPIPTAVSGCLECHTPSPHVTDKRTRAFLNMHLRALDCTVCHLGGKVAYGDLPKPGVEPAELLVTATLVGDEKPPRVQVEEGSGKHLVSAPARFDPKGPECKRCHRRGSTLLRALGRYEGHRRRILEDLEILSLLKGRR